MAGKCMDRDTRREPNVGRRHDVLAALRTSKTPMRIDEIAADLGIHPNTVRFHLDALVGDGQVTRMQTGPSGPGRPALRFQASRRMDPRGPRHYELLADILAASVAAGLDPVATATTAGRAWGERLHAPAETSPMSERRSISRLVHLLDGLGFAPEPRTRQIALRNCPFLDLVQSQPEVVCSVHLGLMQGAMTAMRAPVTIGRLDAFAEPDMCVAHISTTESGEVKVDR
jgi:predicted ArsR family transcriptional regulator